MKGKINFITVILLPMMFSLVRLYPQAWHIYDGSQLPENAGYISADIKGKAIVHSIIDDYDIPGNKLYEYYVDSLNSKQQWEANFGEPVENITVVTRMKSALPDSFIGVSNIRLYNGVNRVVFKLERTRINPENTTQNINYNMNGTEWHIFRFVMNNEFVRVYLDERPKPVMVDTSSSLNSSTYFRWGDGSDGDEYGGLVDWIVWDTSGAYAPGAGPVIPHSLLYPDAPAMVAKWSFNGSPADSVGDAHAVFDGAGIRYIKGVVDSAIDLNNAADTSQLIVPLENCEQLHFGTGSFSVSLFARINPASGEQILFIKGDMDQNLPTTSLERKGNWYGLSSNNNELRFTIDDDVNKTQSGYNVAGIYPPFNVWSHIVGVRDTEKDSTYIYLNGKLLASMLDQTANVMTDSMPITIGGLTYTADRHLSGFIDEIKVFNYALSAAETKAIYDANPVINIIFVSPDDRDSSYINILTDEGYNVTKWYAPALNTEPIETIDMLNRADLVIIGRSPASSNFTGLNKYAWNKKIQVPVILTTQWAARSTRLNWFESANCVHYDTDPDTVIAKINDPSDAVFADATIDADSMMVWSTAPEDAILVDSVINGTVLAVYDTNAILFARFDSCVEFYPGAGATEKPAAPRTYFGMGNDNAGWPHFFTLTDDAKTVLLAEVSRLVELDYTVCTDYPSDNATLASLDVSPGKLKPAFDPGITEYNVTVPAGTDSVYISAVANDAGATVAGAGYVDVSGGSATAVINVTAADGYNKKTYSVNMKIPSIIFATPDDKDSSYIKLLKAEGFNVKKWYSLNLSTEPQDTIDMINSNDLVIIGRSPLSTNFTGANKYAWNKKIQVPVILSSHWAARSTRINWFNSTNAYHLEGIYDTIRAKVLVPGDEIFSGITIPYDSIIGWSLDPEDALWLDSATNGTILVRGADTNSVMVARFDPCTEFYPGAGVTEKPAAPRTLFAFGNDNTGIINLFPLTDDAKTVLLAEINRLMNSTYTVCTDYPSDVATLVSLTVDPGMLYPPFDPGVTEYIIEIFDHTTSIDVVAEATDTGASIAGTGTFNLVGYDTTLNVVVTAADTYNKLTYSIYIIQIHGGIEVSEDEYGIKVYPNPASSVINIEIPGELFGSEIRLINVIGEVIFSDVATSERLQISTEGIEYGLYFIKVGSIVKTIAIE